MVLIGRRDLRSNNSWMHNLPHLVRGKARCTMHVNPRDAERLGLTEGGEAAVSSRAGALVVPVEVTDSIMEGVVSIPHGWGHDAEGARLRGRRQATPGVNSNLLADEQLVDAALRERRAQRHPGRGRPRLTTPVTPDPARSAGAEAEPVGGAVGGVDALALLVAALAAPVDVGDHRGDPRERCPDRSSVTVPLPPFGRYWTSW